MNKEFKTGDQVEAIFCGKKVTGTFIQEPTKGLADIRTNSYTVVMVKMETVRKLD